MRHSKYFRILSLLALISLASCSSLKPEPEIITEVIYVKPDISILDRPRPLDMYNIDFWVVSEKNLDSFLVKLNEEQGAVVFIALTPDDYERLSLNMADIKRYIEQQKSLIVYYEETIKLSTDNKE